MKHTLVLFYIHSDHTHDKSLLKPGAEQAPRYSFGFSRCVYCAAVRRLDGTADYCLITEPKGTDTSR